MNIQDFCVQMNRSRRDKTPTVPSVPSLEALQQLREIDLKALLSQGAMVGLWDVWDRTEAPSHHYGFEDDLAGLPI